MRLPLVSLLVLLLRQNNVVRSYNDKPEEWYQRYTSYPPYCSTPEEMNTRSIPPLRVEDRNVYGETRILHVTAVIRHGARTPWTSSEDCFPKFSSGTEWNCRLTTIMTPPNFEDGDSLFLFEKQYDALPYQKDGLSNELNGTCQVGQLLLRGYEQEFQNGQFLKDAYTYQSDSYDHDERMRLIDISDKEYSAWSPKQLRYRADNDQRTIMSGQVLLRGLFGEQVQQYVWDTDNYPTIPLHIADRERDIVGPNSKVCPKLKDISKLAKQSPEYQAFDNSQESKDVRNFLKEKVGEMDQNTLLDCLMTTICTDRELPDDVNDYGEENSWFQALADYDVQSYNLVMKYNNSEYAKLGMGPLWAEILETWDLFLEGEFFFQSGPPLTPSSDTSDTEETIIPPRLSVYSGHDTTIMPLLASISPNLWNDTDWAPYASMMLIEIHEFIDGWTDSSIFTSSYAFRLIYNGKILTPSVPGCPADLELCDLMVLKNIVEPFATRSQDCASADNNDEKVVDQAKKIMSTNEGISMFLGLLLGGVLLGACGTYVFLTGTFFGSRVLSSAVQEDIYARSGLQDCFEDEFIRN